MAAAASGLGRGDRAGGMTRGRETASSLLALLLVLGGCGGADTPGATPRSAGATTQPAAGLAGEAMAAATPVSSAAAAAPVSSAAAPASLGLRRALEAVDYAFPHSKHGGVDCLRCHTRPASHVTHPDAPCTACHTRPAVLATLPAPARTECLECHHAERPDRPCARCHESAPRAPIPERLSVVTAAGKGPRTRMVAFDHARHSGRACTACHTTPVTRAFGTTCGSCHESHHRAEAECITCHDGRGIAAHDDRSHRSCAGAECHSDRTVLGLPPTRNVCLVCHADRRSHYPGEQCAECHTGFGATIRGARGAR